MSDGTFFYSRKLKADLIRSARQEGKKYVKSFCELENGDIEEYTEMCSDLSEEPVANRSDNVFLGRGKSHHAE